MNDGIQITRIKQEDLPGIQKLSDQLGYPVDLQALQQRFQELAATGDHALFVAKIGQKPVGFLHARKIFDLIEALSIEIAALVVDAAERGVGIGAELVAAAEAWARVEKIKDVWLLTNIKRDRAHRFYERLGYVINKTSHQYVKVVE